MYTGNNGRGGVIIDGVVVVIGNDTAAGPTSPLLQTATPPTPPLLVGQPNVTGGGGGGVVVVGGGYWWWALLAVFLVLATAAGNILVCLAITWERRLQNVTNYFLMSLAVTDLMVAVLVMPVGILTLVLGKFPFASVYCLTWICLDVLFCTASIMHLCTISVDRYLSLRYPMKFGRNKTRRRVILKIVFVWLLSIAMSLPLSLMYSKDFDSVLVNGSCQIPDPLYKLIGSIVSFYIPLGVMILTYTLTVRHLAAKRQNLQIGFTHNSNQNNTRRSWRRMLRRNYRRTRSDETDIRSATGEELTGVITSSTGAGGGRQQKGRGDPTASPSTTKLGGSNGGSVSGSRSTAVAEDDSGAADSVDDSPRFGHHHRHNRDHHHRPTTPGASCRGTPRPFHHNPSVGSTDTEMTSLDARELWLPDTEPTQSTMSALHQFGAEMLRLSRGLEKVASPESKPVSPDTSRLSDNGGGQDGDDDDEDGLCNVDDMDDEEEQDGEEEELEVEVEGVGACDSMCSENASTSTGTPRSRRVKRQRRRRRRSGTLHESMRRRFDGPNHHHHLHYHHHSHPYYHHQHHEQHHHQGRPTRVRSFHEDELTRSRTGPTSSDVNGPATVDSGPKIVGTLLKQEFQRKPGLDEEICLLPPPPRRRQRRRRSESANSGGSATRNVTAASVTSLSPSPVLAARTAHTKTPTQRHPQTATRVDTLTVWSPTSNASKTTTLAVASGGVQPLRRAMTQKPIRKQTPTVNMTSATGKRHSPLVRYGSTLGLPSRPQQQATPQRSNNASRSSVMIRNSYRHGRIIRLEQKATKVLGVVFFTFVFLWTPFFALNLLPSVCPNCEAGISKGLIDLVTWLGYASSMVNPVFYTIFNKVFRQAFKRVLMCKYRGRSKRHSWPPPPPARKV